MPWLNSVAGVFANWYPGQAVGNAMAALIFGTANPSGKLPVTFPSSLSQVPAQTQAQRGFNVIGTANNRDKGVNELSSALMRRFNTVVLPVPDSLEEEVHIAERRVD